MKRPAEGKESEGRTETASRTSERRPCDTVSRSRSFQVRGFLRVADEYAAALDEGGSPNAKRRPFLERMKNRVDLRRNAKPTLSTTTATSTTQCFRDRFKMRLIIRTWSHYAKSWRAGFRFHSELPECMCARSPVKEVRHIGVMGEELAAFLNTLRARDEPRFRAVEHALHMLIPSISGIHVDVNSLGEVELRLREDKTLIPGGVVSEGTLRMLGLLALAGAKEPPVLVGFEEPENGIHPRRLQLIAELLRTRAAAEDTQMIVTTHSPLLVDLIPDEFLYVCRRSDGQTTIYPIQISTVLP